ncbi:LysR family transcriptional regulator [Pedosphaera parvula]|uniref:Transcriptional regulator, LysR family n=1 Tax=Pedosphaera parvula (strain Ellin514) TaxID=320771 RepID=B9XJ57_PEDPL|nr:LysR family transcriptional regulator [Pedosphaera parvula]EEF60095.1 transcriptional regulator, LysR family [Pedosphaera parvula Ellin514]
MELRHLRYFLAVADALNFTKAARQLRIAQPALSRRVQDLEDEIGVDLLKRSPRGVTLTAEGKLFLEKTRQLLKMADESVEQVRALARGQFGSLHIGYAPSPTVEILPPALAAYQRAFPHVNVLLHDASRREIVDGLQDGTLQLAVLPEVVNMEAEGIEFEPLRSYPYYVALSPSHPLTRLKAIPLEKIANEPLVGFARHDYPDYYPFVERIFRPLGVTPKIAVECDSGSSLITAVETGRGVSLAMSVFKVVTGKRLVLRPVAGSKDEIPVGIARAKNGDLTPAGEKFCEFLRKFSKRTPPA